MGARIPVFDGHNDCLLKLWRGADDPVAAFAADGPGHVDLPKARRGGFAGGFFAIFVPSAGEVDIAAMQGAEYDLPLAEPLDEGAALDVAVEQAGILRALDAAGHVALCTDAAGVREAVARGKVAAVMHMEGAEAIAPEISVLDRFHALGLRSIGPVWSRRNRYGSGVAFRFPSTGDTGPGLTEAGRLLVRRAGALGMVVDLSHITERGFWDVAEEGLPLVATHSNAYSICPSARNLSDRQLLAIGETGGMVGLNLAAAFLRPDGRMDGAGALEWIPRHLECMIGTAGEGHVGLGSDFDGAVIPDEIGDAGGLDALRDLLEREGFGRDLVEKLLWRNWVDALERIWGC